jgi:hypothetical protein
MKSLSFVFRELATLPPESLNPQGLSERTRYHPGAMACHSLDWETKVDSPTELRDFSRTMVMHGVQRETFAF